MPDPSFPFGSTYTSHDPEKRRIYLIHYALFRSSKAAPPISISLPWVCLGPAARVWNWIHAFFARSPIFSCGVKTKTYLEVLRQEMRACETQILIQRFRQFIELLLLTIFVCRLRDLSSFCNWVPPITVTITMMGASLSMNINFLGHSNWRIGRLIGTFRCENCRTLILYYGAWSQSPFFRGKWENGRTIFLNWARRA